MSNSGQTSGATVVRPPSPGNPARGTISLLLPDLSVGGAERNLVRLAGELHRRGRAVHLVLGRARGPLSHQLPAGVPVIDLDRSRLRSALGPLVAYLRRTRPAVLVATVGHANVLAVAAARLARTGTPVVARVANSAPGSAVPSDLQTRLALSVYRAAYRKADGLVVNSEGSRALLADFLGMDPAAIQRLPNLTVGPELESSSTASVDHPWFRPDQPPVIVAVGRLTTVKNHRLLIDAVAQLRRTRPVRLVILGEGELREELEAQIRALEAEDAVALLGHVDDPLPYLRSATVFCLPSNREGMPNALIEALAAGCAVVATDCRSGPRELLADGRHGRLVPVGDLAALTTALGEALDDPQPAADGSWRAHTVEGAGAAYEAYLDDLVRTGGRT